MQLKDVMTKNPQSIPPDTSVHEAASRMRQLNVGVLPVVENGQPRGILTDRDITIRAVAEGLPTQKTAVSDIMTTPVEAVRPDTDVRQAAQLLEQKQIRRLCVVDDSGKLQGIVSLGDLAVQTHDSQLCGEILEKVSEPAQPAHA